MAVPKKKVSRSRRNTRRFASGNKMVIPTGVICGDCGSARRPHRVCQCGMYNGQRVLNNAAATASAAGNPTV